MQKLTFYLDRKIFELKIWRPNLEHTTLYRSTDTKWGHQTNGVFENGRGSVFVGEKKLCATKTLKTLLEFVKKKTLPYNFLGKVSPPPSPKICS